MPTRYELLARMIHEGDKAIQALSTEFEKPELQAHKAFGRAYRHKQKHDLLASFLKLVRIASCLNASLVLLRHGYIQEVFILCRTIDEAGEDIKFLAEPLGQDGRPTKHQRRFIEEFFQEEFGDATKPAATIQKRDRVPRRKIHAALTKNAAAPLNPSDTLTAVDGLHRVMSGFVHGAYGHIMELYGGIPARYHTQGMLNTPRIATCEENLVSHVFRALIAVEIVARRIGRHDVALHLNELSIELAEATGCLSQDGIQRAKARLSIWRESI